MKIPTLRQAILHITSIKCHFHNSITVDLWLTTASKYPGFCPLSPTHVDMPSSDPNIPGGISIDSGEMVAPDANFTVVDLIPALRCCRIWQVGDPFPQTNRSLLTLYYSRARHPPFRQVVSANSYGGLPTAQRGSTLEIRLSIALSNMSNFCGGLRFEIRISFARREGCRNAGLRSWTSNLE